jgi:hypothetical protein
MLTMKSRALWLVLGAVGLVTWPQRDLDARAAVSLVASELLGRPTATSITVNAIFDQAVEVRFECGTAADALKLSRTTVAPDGHVKVALDGLDPDTRYFYRMSYRTPHGRWTHRDVHQFHTQRGPASGFTFAVQSDSHQGFAPFYDAGLYRVTMQNLRADAPDFVVDLGDTFSLDDDTETEASVAAKYLAQRAFLSIFAHSSPLFLVLGNHENEEGWNLDDAGPGARARSLPVLGANARKTYFANPVPDGFYTGNEDASTAEIIGDHLKEDYYAFEWGNALFVMIDPFWYTTEKPYAGAIGGEHDDEVVIGDRWSWTLGKQQYDWLARTLRGTSRRFIFVFAHQLTGGTVDYSRGGRDGARYAEWGGYDTDGTTWAFDKRRPGWEKPIHELFRETNVTAFFHGHDHVYAREELDGIVYQLVPHPACPHPRNRRGFTSNERDYTTAVMADNSGYLRVRVEPERVVVQYVRSFLPGAGDNGRVEQEYEIPSPGGHP